MTCFAYHDRDCTSHVDVRPMIIIKFILYPHEHAILIFIRCLILILKELFMECFCVDKDLLLVADDDIFVLESDCGLLKLSFHCILLLLFVLKIFLLLLSEEPIEILCSLENILDRRKFHVVHFYHYLKFLILQNLLHVGYLFELFLYNTMSIFLLLDFHDLLNFSFLQLGHIALIINIFDSPDYCERIVDAL